MDHEAAGTGRSEVAVPIAGTALLTAAAGAGLYLMPPAAGAIAALAAIAAAIGLQFLGFRRAGRALRRCRSAVDQLQAGVDSMPGHFVVFDADDRLVMCNALYRSLHIRGFERHGDHPRYEDLMRATAELACDDPADVEAWVASHVASHRPADGTPADRSYPDGTWIRVTKHRTASAGVVGYGADVTELKQREQALEESEERYFALTESAPVGIWQFDATGATVYANPVFRRLLGVADDAVAVGEDLRPFDRLRPEAGEGDVRALLLAGEELTQLEARLTRSDGSERVLLVVRSPAIAGRRVDRSFVATVLDITERRQAERQAEYLARHDRLTGLANRTAFTETIERMAERADADSAFGVILIDLNFFKDVNDTFGHGVGDELLAEAATRIRDAVGERGFAARLGGDEFAIAVASPTDCAQVIALAAAVNERLASGYAIGGRSVHVGASAGVALYPDHSRDVESLLRFADIALYHSKGERDDRVTCFEHHMSTTLGERKQLENELRAALEDGELELTYQPQYELAGGRLVGFEALARWHNARLCEEVPPDVFIPLAERSGLILDLEAWVLHTACREALQWAGDDTMAPLVAVNLSAAEFRRERAVPLVRQALEATGLPPARLELEITEDILLGEVRGRRDTLSELRRDGVRIAIDDFGQGNAAIGVLRDLPLDRLKLDKGFVVAADPAAGAHAVAAAIVDVGNSFGLDVVAQGIESPAHVEYARRLGCTQGQGVHLAAPLRADDARRLIEG